MTLNFAAQHPTSPTTYIRCDTKQRHCKRLPKTHELLWQMYRTYNWVQQKMQIFYLILKGTGLPKRVDSKKITTLFLRPSTTTTPSLIISG